MKQFIVDRHTTPNTPTLEQVPTEKIPIYENRAAVTADLANLSVGQIVATKDTGDELAQPVDVVEEGNLHAVTSNAVYEYSNPQTTIIESTTKRTVSLTAGRIEWFGANLELPSIPENKRLIRYIPYVSLSSNVAAMVGFYRTGNGIITPCIVCISDVTANCDIWWAAEVADK